MLIASYLVEQMKALPGPLAVFFTSILPITESRVSVPLAITFFKMHPWEAVVYSSLSGIIVTVFLLWLLGPVSGFLIKHSVLAQRFFNWLFIRTRNKFVGSYEKYGLLALMIFVAIPLPGSGVWTGSLIVFIFGMSFRKAFIFISFGAIIASILVALATTGILGVINFFI